MTGGRSLGRALAIAVVATVAMGEPAAHVQRAPVRRALIIGIDRYLPPPPQVDGVTTRPPWPNLHGAVNDADAMQAVLRARYGFRADHIRVLRNEEATRARILHETRAWLVQAAAPGDVSVFFYAGHGSQVRNSRSTELDGMDETIVPTDANLGHPDIRDKELRVLFNEAVDKGIVLTAIVDSCHSGSVARSAGGGVRLAPPDPRDVADPTSPVPPNERGALIVSATQDRQLADEIKVADAGGVAMGRFTWALLRVLRSRPISESAEAMFLRVRALMQADGSRQEPVLAGLDHRRRAPLFGGTGQESSSLVVAAAGVDGEGGVILQGGFAAGLRPGAELRSIDSARGPVLRVVATLGPSQSRAGVISGAVSSIRPGSLFELTRWAAPSTEALRVSLRSARRGDPALPDDTAAAYRAAHGVIERLVELRDEPAGADYVLAGRTREGRSEYAWARPDVTGDDVNTAMPPALTRWVPLGPNQRAFVTELRGLAEQLSRIRHWLTLEAPPVSAPFPYRLALKQQGTGVLHTGGVATAGEYEVVLVRDERAPLARGVVPRYVYAFAINGDGERVLLFPSAAAGNVEHLLPVQRDPARLPAEIGLIRVALDPGVAVVLLLTTATALPDPSVLAGEAVRSIGGSRDPLSLLLSPDDARGVSVVTPVDWSIDRFTVRTVAGGDLR
jgi:hypothetical protein